MSSSFSFPFSSPFGSGFLFAPSPGGTPLEALNATPIGVLGQTDQLIDPVTLDYVRTDNGEWAETGDARTSMMMMIAMELGASPFDPVDGTTIGARLRAGDPVTPEEIREETARVGAIFQAEGIISEFDVSVRDERGELLRDAAGRLLVRTSWRDLGSGSPVDAVFRAG